MVEQAGALPGEAETSLADSRAQFVTSLGRRLEALRLALGAVEQAPRSVAHRDHLRRRIHAFGAAAGVLGFERVFEAFREAEGVLGRLGSVGVLEPSDAGVIARTIDLVPSLVMGADVPLTRGRSAQHEPGALERRGSFPTSVLVFGAAPLVESLRGPGPSLGTPALECDRTEDPARAEEMVRAMAPDVAVIDADRRGARELMETLVYDPLLDPVRVIAIGTFDRPEAAASLVALGVARVLPKPVSPDTLKRSVLEVARERTIVVPRWEPIGDVTVEALGERLTHELQRGLTEAVKTHSRGFTVSLGDGTDVLAAIWASVARIRELVTLRSGGAVRFDATGPEGAVPLVPWMGEDRHRGAASTERRSSTGVELTGRVVVVADDDPAIAWFLSGLLRAVGAEVLEAHDGDRALELVRERWPDLVVSDVLMPGLDGFALCREIKRDIALSDVPVILLSWKEDLLQRVRELGAEADGYLRKEATASTVVERAKEVLLPRARIEARIAGGGEARGRLDGITPRLVLELVCKGGANARVSIRDAGFLYEVHVRSGRVRAASRTSIAGRSDRGERVLAALLGVRAGRFAVQRDDSECPNDWNGDLRELFAMPVDRARAASRALSELSRVARVDVDTSALEPYLAATPQSAREVVRLLGDGASPDDIVAGGSSARLLESVLADVVLHGGILRVLATDGTDLFARELGETRRRRAGPAREPEAQRPASSASTAPAVEADVKSPDPAEALRGASAEWSPAEPLDGAPHHEELVFSLPPGDPEGAARQVATGSETAIDDPESAFASLLSDSVPPASSAPPGRIAPRPFAQKGLAPPTSAPAEPSPLETALKSVPESVAPRASSSSSANLPIVLPEVSSAKQERPSPPRPEPRAAEPEEAPAVDLGAAVLLGIGEESRAVDERSARREVDAESARRQEKPAPPDTGRKSDAARTPAAEPRPESPSTKEAESPPSSKNSRSAERDASSARSDTSPPSRTRRAVTSPAPSGTKAEQNARPAEGNRLGMIAFVVGAAAASFALVRFLESPSSSGPPVASSAPAPELSATPEPSSLPMSALTETPSAAQSAPPPAAPSATLVASDLALPDGVAVAPERGLLEVELPEARSIYVDGVFIGRGPTRQLLLREGQHEVKVRSDTDGSELSANIDVKKARRTRLALNNPK